MHAGAGDDGQIEPLEAHDQERDREGDHEGDQQAYHRHDIEVGEEQLGDRIGLAEIASFRR